MTPGKPVITQDTVRLDVVNDLQVPSIAWQAHYLMPNAAISNRCAVAVILTICSSHNDYIRPWLKGVLKHLESYYKRLLKSSCQRYAYPYSLPSKS